MADFVDGAAVAMAEDLKLFEVGGSGSGGGGCSGGSSSGGWREREREAGTAVGEVGEAEVQLAAITNQSH